VFYLFIYLFIYFLRVIIMSIVLMKKSVFSSFLKMAKDFSAKNG